MTGVRLVAIPQNLTLTTLAIGGAAIGTDALAVTGTSTFNSQVNISGVTLSMANGNIIGAAGIRLGSSSDARWQWAAAASIQQGAPDVDTGPIAQTLRSQGTLAGGTSDVAGVNWTFIASPGKGTGAGGSFIFQTAPAGSTGTVVNAAATVLTLDSTKLATFAGALSAVGPLTFNTNIAGIVLKRGANGLCGTFVANGATPVVVSNTNVAITDTIIISLNTIGGTVGVQPHVSAITAATSFAVTCTAVDTSTYNYAIIKNAA